MLPLHVATMAGLHVHVYEELTHGFASAMRDTFHLTAFSDATFLNGIVFAVPVAWFNRRRHLGNALQSESRGGTSGRAAQVLRHSFIVSQIALAFILLAGAGLLGLSLQRVMAVSSGFQSDHVLAGHGPAPRPGQDLPRPARPLPQEQALPTAAGRRATTDQPRRHNPRVVPHQDVARIQELGELGEAPVLPATPPPVDHH